MHLMTIQEKHILARDIGIQKRKLWGRSEPWIFGRYFTKLQYFRMHNNVCLFSNLVAWLHWLMCAAYTADLCFCDFCSVTPNRPSNYFAKQMNPPSSYNSQNKKTPLHDQTRARG